MKCYGGPTNPQSCYLRLLEPFWWNRRGLLQIFHLKNHLNCKAKTKTSLCAKKNFKPRISLAVLCFSTRALERDTSLREELVVSVSSTVCAIKGIWNTHCALSLRNPLSTRQPVRHTLEVGAREETCITKGALVVWSQTRTVNTTAWKPILSRNLKFFYLSLIKLFFFSYCWQSKVSVLRHEDITSAYTTPCLYIHRLDWIRLNLIDLKLENYILNRSAHLYHE